MRLLIFITLILGFNNSFGQPYRLDYVEFYDYQTVLTDLRQHGKESKYYENLDYESMLYLDRASFKTLLSINNNFLKEHNIDTSNIFFHVPKESINEFPVNYVTLKEFFSSKSSWIKIMKQLLIKKVGDNMDFNIDNKVYMKNDNKAITTFYCSGGSVTYRITLIDKKLRFEFLSEIQE